MCNVELRMGDRLGIELDYCPQCRGVWLEKGKLDRILEKSASAPVAPAADSRPDPYAGPYRESDRHHDTDDYAHGHGYGRRKKSFLSDLFD